MDLNATGMFVAVVQAGSQPLGGIDPSRNPASNTEPPNPGPGAAAQSATTGALGARHKIDRRWGKAVRARQPRGRGAAGGRASRDGRSGAPEGTPAPVVAPDVRAVVGSAGRLPASLPRNTGLRLLNRAPHGPDRGRHRRRSPHRRGRSRGHGGATGTVLP